MRVTQMPATAEKRERREASFVPSYRTAETNKGGIDLKKILSRFEKDDYILAGLIIVLVFEGCEDYVLLAALGYLFIMGLRT